MQGAHTWSCQNVALFCSHEFLELDCRQFLPLLSFSCMSDQNSFSHTLSISFCTNHSDILSFWIRKLHQERTKISTKFVCRYKIHFLCNRHKWKMKWGTKPLLSVCGASFPQVADMRTALARVTRDPDTSEQLTVAVVGPTKWILYRIEASESLR
jgi:hypothetical protein